ncbi:MAG: hypothetical protein AAGF11_55445 [Myxococcota bacterium]
MRRCTHIFVLVGIIAAAPASAWAAPQRADAVSPASPNQRSASTSANEVNAKAVRLSVDTSAMGKEAKSTRAWVLRDGGKALAEAGVMVAADTSTEVQVILEPKDLGYTVRIEVREDGTESPIFTRGPKICENCTRTELIGMVGRELAWVGGWLSGSDAEQEQEPDPETVAIGDATEDGLPEQSEPEPGDSLEDHPPRRRKLHALGWSGIGVGTVGLGTLVGGFTIILRNYEARGEPGDYRIPSVRPERVGWTMVGLGAAALVGGSVMLMFDLAKGNQTGVAAGPWLEPGAGGLWVRRRF